MFLCLFPFLKILWTFDANQGLIRNSKALSCGVVSKRIKEGKYGNVLMLKGWQGTLSLFTILYIKSKASNLFSGIIDYLRKNGIIILNFRVFTFFVCM